MERENMLSRTFVELADSLVDDFDLVELMGRLTERTTEIAEGSAAGLVLLDGYGALRFMAATSEAIEVVEALQIQTDEGPCRDCCRSGLTVVADDLRDFVDRWPRFVPAATEAGYRSVHAFPLRLRGQALGALGVFHATVKGIADDDATIIQAFADVATIALLQARTRSESQTLATQLQHALDSRIVIEQAKGVVAERSSVHVGQAFELLRSYARTHQQRVSDVARDTIDGSLDPEVFSA